MSTARPHTSIARFALVALIAVFAACAVVLGGCASSQAKGSETLEATFGANAGTGYEWTCAIEDEQIVILDESIVKDEAEPDVAGGPLSYVFTLKAADNGTDGKTNVTFKYARSWEENPDDVVVTWEVESKDGLLTIGSYDGPADYKDALAVPEK